MKSKIFAALLATVIFISIRCNSSQNMVYICNGKLSHAYHSIENCKGLTHCTTDIETITLDNAKVMGRTPCHFCH